MKSVRLDIEGLQLDKTQDKVRNQLEGVIGVEKVCTSPGQTYVDVFYNEETSEQELGNHLQNNGYKIIDKDME